MQEIVYTVPETREERLRVAAETTRRIKPTRLEEEEAEQSISLTPTGHSDAEEELEEAAAFAAHVLANPAVSETTVTAETEAEAPDTPPAELIAPPPSVLAGAAAVSSPTPRVATGIRLGDLVQAGLGLGDRVVDPEITKRLAEAVSIFLFVTNA